MPELHSLTDRWIPLQRDIVVVEIPDGTHIPLAAGTDVEIVHELGGDFTVRGRIGRLFRIDGTDADAIGREPIVRHAPPNGNGNFNSAFVEKEDVMAALRTCFDPEIPVNLVDLGLIYDTIIEPHPGGEGQQVNVTMTLTAPGCGMGQVVVDDVCRKVRAVPGVKQVNVDIVFDPPWNPCMMTDAARLAVGLM